MILSVLEELVAPETAGDPMTAQKWVRSSLRTLSVKLEAAGHVISPPTVGRLLRKLDYSLHVNSKKIEASSAHPDRDQQFDYIAVQRARFTAAGLPIISTDSTRKRSSSATSRTPARPGRSSQSPSTCMTIRMTRSGGLCRTACTTSPPTVASSILAPLATRQHSPSMLSPRGGKVMAKPPGLATTSWCWQTRAAATGAACVPGKNVYRCKFAIVLD